MMSARSCGGSPTASISARLISATGSTSAAGDATRPEATTATELARLSASDLPRVVGVEVAAREPDEQLALGRLRQGRVGGQLAIGRRGRVAGGDGRGRAG